MGGSTKQVVEKVEKETKNVGRGVVHGGTQLAEGTKKMVNTTAAGLEGAGKALPGAIEGFGKGLGSVAMEGMAGLKHNLDQVASVFMPGSGGGDSAKAQSASANYSGSSKRSRSGAKKKGDLEAGERKGATGKQKLYARRKTA